MKNGVTINGKNYAYHELSPKQLNIICSPIMDISVKLSQAREFCRRHLQHPKAKKYLRDLRSDSRIPFQKTIDKMAKTKWES